MDLMSIHLQQRKAHLGLLTNVTVTGGDGTMYHNVSATYNTNYPNHLTQVSQQLGNGTAVTDLLWASVCGTSTAMSRR